ncbi:MULTISPECIES: hypothetical protein [unclassified Paenibacillus]|uniref:hypothetical protein n=1 Tax=unclassified Paenibacillus TaxID=185978 RepID=UPI0018CF21A0|nr:hypothetical protein [Paenibacillus sp. FSL P4-0081]
MIVVESLMDESAFSWQADWYRNKVHESMGDQLHDRFRLWYVEHSLHHDAKKGMDNIHDVSYVSVLHQELRDLSLWVEEGTIPPSSTKY